MHRILLYLLLITSSCTLSQTVSESLEIGEILKLQSELLNEERIIYINTPKDYVESNEKLPVIYVLDGEYRFEPTFGIYSYISYWGELPKAIIVGIPNISRETRNRDYLPSSYGGNADTFLLFMVNELIPFVEENYNTSTERVIVGHSHGGVFVTYTFLKKPELFTGFIATDPSLSGLYEFAVTRIQETYSGQNFYLSSSDVGSQVNPAIKQSHLQAFERFKVLIESKKPKNINLKISHISDDHANSYVQGCSEGLRHALGRIKQ